MKHFLNRLKADPWGFLKALTLDLLHLPFQFLVYAILVVALVAAIPLQIVQNLREVYADEPHPRTIEKILNLF